MMKLSIPADGNRGKKSSEIELGLHDPRFLPFGGVGIGRPGPTGRRPQLASMKWGASGPGVLGPTAGGQRAERAPDV